MKIYTFTIAVLITIISLDDVLNLTKNQCCSTCLVKNTSARCTRISVFAESDSEMLASLSCLIGYFLNRIDGVHTDKGPVDRSLHSLAAVHNDIVKTMRERRKNIDHEDEGKKSK